MDDALPRRAYLGLDLERPDEGPGLMVTEVAPGSAAQRAGLRHGDRILSIAGDDELDLQPVRTLVAGLTVGARCEVVLQRAGVSSRCIVEVGPMPLEPLEGGRVELSHIDVGGARLRTVWTIPDSPGPHPAVWIVPGLTWISDEHPLQPLHPTFQIVQGLTRAGFATLRAERSGLGDSEGPPCMRLDLEAELQGFVAGMRQLQCRRDVDPARRFVFGRSLGGMLIPLLVRGQPFAGVAVWGTSADDWLQATLTTSARQLALGGLAGEALHDALARIDAMAHLLYVERLTPSQAHARDPSLRDVQPQNFSGETIYGRTAAYFHQLQQAQVAAAWAQVRCPVLAMYGDCDYVTCEDDLRGVVAAVGPSARLALLSGVDHHMHDRDSLWEAHAEHWGGTFSPRALQRLVEFLREPTAGADS